MLLNKNQMNFDTFFKEPIEYSVITDLKIRIMIGAYKNNLFLPVSFSERNCVLIFEFIVMYFFGILSVLISVNM